MSSAAEWSREEEKAFENAIALHCTDDSNGEWERIASMVPSKTLEELKKHYKLLVEDVLAIEAGHVPIPNYGFEESTTTSSSTKDSCGFSGMMDKGTCPGQGSGFSGFNQDPNGHGGKGSGSRSDQERRKGIPWTEEEHRYVLLHCINILPFLSPFVTSCVHTCEDDSKILDRKYLVLPKFEN